MEVPFSDSVGQRNVFGPGDNLLTLLLFGSKEICFFYCTKRIWTLKVTKSESAIVLETFEIIPL